MRALCVVILLCAAGCPKKPAAPGANEPAQPAAEEKKPDAAPAPPPPAKPAGVRGPGDPCSGSEIK